MIDETAADMMSEWLHAILVNPRFIKLLSSFDVDDEIRRFRFSLKR